MVQKPQGDAENKEGRIDLSLPQVAGSALAAVAAAVMASQLGVYGTIAGAGVMSVVATCGGSVFQHFFRRTGEQIREVTVQVKHPAGRQVTVRTRETRPAPRGPEDEATRMLRAAAPDADRTTMLRQVRPGGAGADAERTTVLRQVRPDGGGPDGGAVADESWSRARTHGTRVRGWKRSALAATGVFVLSMAGITLYELASGHDLGGNGGTTIGSVVSGERHGGTGSTSPSGSPDTEDGGGDGTDQERGATTAPGTGTGPGADRSGSPAPGDEGGATEPAPTPSAPPATEGDTTPETTAPTTPGTGSTPPAAPEPSGAGQVPDQQGGASADADR
ncbi:hypothetical protein [Streptomyces sp. NPDC059166]|uniref:hypothetical protein n=1 Tax=Streptomyces sp. NPDC059166 TaxID=3346752 RepID=UPI0036994A18